MLPALFETDDLNPSESRAITAWIARSDAAALVARGRSMGLAIAAEHEIRSSRTDACIELVAGCAASAMTRRVPRVLDLSGLWAGPLAAHLLWLAGAEVVKVESRTRPDAMRRGNAEFYALLNQGKASVVLDFADTDERQALISLIRQSDIVIEAARPRALMQFGIDAVELVRSTPGLIWISITGHGAEGEAAGWVGFGDDCSVAGGLSAALREASGRTGFVGDAIADPLTGIFAALTASEARTSRRGGRFGITMSQMIAHCLARARDDDPDSLKSKLIAWARAAGKPYPAVARRHVGAAPAFGEHTHSYLAQSGIC
jgi:hypothetical protein